MPGLQLQTSYFCPDSDQSRQPQCNEHMQRTKHSISRGGPQLQRIHKQTSNFLEDCPICDFRRLRLRANHEKPRASTPGFSDSASLRPMWRKSNDSSNDLRGEFFPSSKLEAVLLLLLLLLRPPPPPPGMSNSKAALHRNHPKFAVGWGILVVCVSPSAVKFCHKVFSTHLFRQFLVDSKCYVENILIWQ